MGPTLDAAKKFKGDATNAYKENQTKNIFRKAVAAKNIANDAKELVNRHRTQVTGALTGLNNNLTSITSGLPGTNVPVTDLSSRIGNIGPKSPYGTQAFNKTQALNRPTIVTIGGKTKSNRKTNKESKVKRPRKPRTKKCLVTKGNQMYMSFCV